MESIILTFMDVQHEAIEVDSLFRSVFYTGVKDIHEHGLSGAWKGERLKKKIILSVLI